jgi:uncharacterized RDD family membrane protein YckC
METTRIEEVVPAGFWLRTAAYAIDTLILMVPTVISLFVTSPPLYLLLAAIVIFYKPVCEGYLGATAGKLALNLRVEDLAGGRPTLVTALVRNTFFILPAVPNLVLGLRMMEAGISPLDPQAVQRFQADNSLLYTVLYSFLLLMFISCLLVAFRADKRALHDQLADTRVVRTEV